MSQDSTNSINTLEKEYRDFLDDFLSSTSLSFLSEDLKVTAQFPTWFIIGGGGAWREASWLSRLWTLFYVIGVISYNPFMLYRDVISVREEQVFSYAFITITPVNPMLENTGKIVAFVTCFATYWSLFFVLRKPIDWKIIRMKNSVSHIFFYVHFSIMIVFMVFANLIDPGISTDCENIFLYGVGGTIFIWLPFTIPMMMFLSEVEVQSRSLGLMCHGLAHALESDQKDILRAGDPYSITNESLNEWRVRLNLMTHLYFQLYRMIYRVSERYASILALQLIVLIGSLGLNCWQLLYSIQIDQAFYKYGLQTNIIHLSIIVTTLSILQLLVCVSIPSRLNLRGLELRRLLAQNSVMMPLVHQMAICPPHVLIGGVDIFNPGKILVLLITYLGFYILGVLKQLTE